MTSRDVFGLIVRTMGLLLTLWGLGMLIAQLLDSCFTIGYYRMPYAGRPGELPRQLSNMWPTIIASLALGVPLLLWSPSIVNLLYRQEN